MVTNWQRSNFNNIFKLKICNNLPPKICCKNVVDVTILYILTSLLKLKVEIWLKFEFEEKYSIWERSSMPIKWIKNHQKMPKKKKKKEEDHNGGGRNSWSKLCMWKSSSCWDRAKTILMSVCCVAWVKKTWRRCLNTKTSLVQWQ